MRDGYFFYVLTTYKSHPEVSPSEATSIVVNIAYDTGCSAAVPTGTLSTDQVAPRTESYQKARLPSHPPCRVGIPATNVALPPFVVNEGFPASPRKTRF